jgi:hypothetical protein
MTVSEMGPLIWVGFLTFFAVALIVGLRLLLLWWHTREIPELLIGIGVLGIGPVGFGMAVAARAVAGSRPGLGAALVGIGALAVAIGASAKFTFNWRVYHPGSRAVGVIPVVAGLLLLAAWITEWATGRFVDVNPATPATLIRTSLQISCLLWGSAEALRYWVMMRRRLRIGLGDPVVANRFLMWGIGAGAAGLGSFIGVAAQIATGTAGAQVSWAMVSSSLHGLIAAIALWLAFVPPTFYRRFIEDRSPDSAIA